MNAATSFADLKYVSLATRPSTGRKPTRKFRQDFGIVGQEQLDFFADVHQLTDEEKQLIDYVDLQNFGFEDIGSVIGVTRQCVSQKYTNLYNRISGKK